MCQLYLFIIPFAFFLLQLFERRLPLKLVGKENNNFYYNHMIPGRTVIYNCCKKERVFFESRDGGCKYVAYVLNLHKGDFSGFVTYPDNFCVVVYTQMRESEVKTFRFG